MNILLDKGIKTPLRWDGFRVGVKAGKKSGINPAQTGGITFASL